MDMLARMTIEQLMELFDDRGIGWDRGRKRVHDEIARRVRATGIIQCGRWTLRPTDDDSFYREATCRKPDPEVREYQGTRYGRAVDTAQATPGFWRRRKR